MQTIALLARKGGAGKTTIAIHIGVEAWSRGHRVLFVDLDPQRSLGTWWRLRQADQPHLVETNARQLADVLDAAATEYDLAIIDTPPATAFEAHFVATRADLAVIPLRPSMLDITAVEATADVVRQAGTPALLLLNACPPPRGILEGAVTRDARRALAGFAVPIADVVTCDRRDFSRALNGGEAVGEFSPAGKAASEVRRLWREIQGRIATYGKDDQPGRYARQQRGR